MGWSVVRAAGDMGDKDADQPVGKSILRPRMGANHRQGDRGAKSERDETTSIRYRQLLHGSPDHFLL